MGDPVGLKPFLCDGVDKSLLRVEWEKWLRSLKLYLTVEEITDDLKKRNRLLHLGGVQLQDVAYSLPGAVIEKAEGTDVFNVLVDKLSEYFSPKQNSTFERHIFRNIKPETGEDFGKFLLRIRHQAGKCSFGKTEAEAKETNLKDKIIDNWAPMDLKRKILEKERTLNEIIEICQIHEQISCESHAMDNRPVTSSSMINKIKFQKSDTSQKCSRCGRNGHINDVQRCPARDAKCFTCGMQGHFALCCKTSSFKRKLNDSSKFNPKRSRNRVNCLEIEEEEGSDKEDVRKIDCFQVKYCQDKVNEVFSDGVIECLIGGVRIRLLIDSGSDANVIKASDFEHLMTKKAIMWDIVDEVSDVLKPYASTKPLSVLKKFSSTINVPQRKEVITNFHVVSDGDISIVGKKTAKNLQILKLGLDVNRIQDMSIFPTIKGVTVKLTIDPHVKPVQQPVRWIPIAVEKLVEDKLDLALKRGIIEKVKGPSAWISPMVIVFKPNGDLRICIDMRRANQAIIRENYPIPTFESIMTRLRDAKFFSRIDLTDAYHQLQLDEESRHITTFITHKGLYRYTRLMFGVNSAVEIFQKTLEVILSPCKNCFNFLDDIIVFGSDEKEHDMCLDRVLLVLDQCGATRNEAKCLYKVKELKFLGHTLSDRGIDVDRKKIETILNFRMPVTKEELRSFLGLITYVGKFLPDLGTETDFLRNLVKKETPFVWTEQHAKCFEKLKENLVNLPTLSYFHPAKRTRLVADASPVALGAVLLQFNEENYPQVISFASKSLSDVERRYSQTEKESLTLVWAVERFYLYLAGLRFELETDHKPLEAIFRPTSKPPARIERWLLRLQAFDFKVIYRPGKCNIADPLSRLCKIQEEKSFDAENEAHILRIIEYNVPKAITLNEIIQESKMDSEITDAISKIDSNCWLTRDENVYYPYRMELSKLSSLLLRGNRIVIPKLLRQTILELAHEGHPGETVMKRRLRSKVWWPTVDKEVTKFVKSCRDCLLVSQPNHPPPMARHVFPQGPWQCLAIDLMGPLPNKDMILVVIDYFSRFQEIRFLKSTTSSIIIKHLNEIFLRFGIPKSIKSDNGPQFVSEEFKNYCSLNNIDLIHSSPYWPQANGEVENMNRSILKRLQIAHNQGKDYQVEIQRFLLMYNATPHGTTGKSPSELLYGRNIRDKIPCVNDLISDEDFGEARDNDFANKQKGGIREDDARNAKTLLINVGDKVVAQRTSFQNKLQSRFVDDEYEIISKKGNELSLLKDGVVYKRHVSHVKKLPDVGNIVPNVQDTLDPVLSDSTSGNEAGQHYSSSPSPSGKATGETLRADIIKQSEEAHTSNIVATPPPSSPKVTPLKLKKKEGLWQSLCRKRLAE
ncbi:hypothetical protein TKK_0005775 [Trichogramma kaykai]|uniref:RNA-directed DNA polymerase n=1 Tax=Trichogramma kaykai TaxID=54128 RepID=A0ABD2XH78_9HYME